MQTGGLGTPGKLGRPSRQAKGISLGQYLGLLVRFWRPLVRAARSRAKRGSAQRIEFLFVNGSIRESKTQLAKTSFQGV